jgi:hypothetical protein
MPHKAMNVSWFERFMGRALGSGCGLKVVSDLPNLRTTVSLRRPPRLAAFVPRLNASRLNPMSPESLDTAGAAVRRTCAAGCALHRGARPTGAVMLRGKTEALLAAQQRRSPQPISTQENLSELLMVTDAKLSLQNRRHDARGDRFCLLMRGLRSGDTDCAGPDNRHPNRNRPP